MSVFERLALADTVTSIDRVQLDSGCIPWFPGGHSDPWNHVECAMALDVGGRHEEAERAYMWLTRMQHGDGSWAAYYRNDQIEDGTLDANFCAYIAAGAWHHFIVTGDRRFIEKMWPAVEAAIDFTLDLQDASGAILWARDTAYRPWPRALVTSSSCIHLSLHAAIALAEEIGCERPDWELSLTTLRDAVATGAGSFEAKDRYSMDWYYPVLGGVVTGAAGRERLLARWDDFVVEGLGVRCVAGRPWVTTGETCELVVALALAGMTAEAAELYRSIEHLRAEDGAYWTGRTFPDGVLWPEEKTTWSGAAAVLAGDVLDGGATLELFSAPIVTGRGFVSEPVVDAREDAQRLL